MVTSNKLANLLEYASYISTVNLKDSFLWVKFDPLMIWRFSVKQHVMAKENQDVY